jgi:hypothetical protein
MKPGFLSVPPQHFRSHAGELAPDVDVHVVDPGNFVRLAS